jgi:hypothetical protein
MRNLLSYITGHDRRNKMCMFVSNYVVTIHNNHYAIDREYCLFVVTYNIDQWWYIKGIVNIDKYATWFSYMNNSYIVAPNAGYNLHQFDKISDGIYTSNGMFSYMKNTQFSNEKALALAAYFLATQN